MPLPLISFPTNKQLKEETAEIVKLHAHASSPGNSATWVWMTELVSSTFAFLQGPYNLVRLLKVSTDLSEPQS